jgi:hypothetical protein
MPLSDRIVAGPGVKSLLGANTVRPVSGERRMVLVNLVTGEQIHFLISSAQKKARKSSRVQVEDFAQAISP